MIPPSHDLEGVTDRGLLVAQKGVVESAGIVQIGRCWLCDVYVVFVTLQAYHLFEYLVATIAEAHVVSTLLAVGTFVDAYHYQNVATHDLVGYLKVMALVLQVVANKASAGHRLLG